MVVAVVTLATYATVTALLTARVDMALEEDATSLLGMSMNADSPEELGELVDEYRAFHPRSRTSIEPPQWAFAYGDSIPLGGAFRESGGGIETSIRTIGDERVVVKRHSSGATVALARDMTDTRAMVATLGTVLVTLAAAGILLAIMAGLVVSKAGLRPITRLQRAADYVTQTNDLRPIMVVGTDEMAQLTLSFNEMLAALQETRTRQSQFVADAGHELKTPLTSMRTNIELLMMANQSGNSASIPEEDRRELEKDVIAQMNELSTLIGDLVDLAREDASQKKTEKVELHEIVGTSLSRARRRRPDVDFQVRIEPWILEGDEFSLARAVLNLIDNAAKWSPPSGTVRISMRQINDSTLRLRVDDSGPGIPAEDREKVFERFYRSAEARSMPGSGLGLAIVRQVIERHEGSIRVLDSPDGGARLEALFPGYRGEGEVDSDPGFLNAEDGNERKKIFAERWFNQD
ncbi:HAMP domain-containing histidine kinase [Corynebacterium phocae]|nr:HAMP domain-containing histidine kinase [Corynebacterium phocae]